MLISVLNIKLTCEWHKAIKLNYKKHSHLGLQALYMRKPRGDVTWLTVQSVTQAQWTLHSLSRTLALSRDVSAVQVAVFGTARSPHFSLAIISVTAQLWIQVFWVISVYFKIRNTLPKSGTFLLAHPVYRDKLQNCSCNRLNMYTLVQVELNNMYINMGANSGSEKLWTKKPTATSGKLIKAVYASYVYVYTFCTS